MADWEEVAGIEVVAVVDWEEGAGLELTTVADELEVGAVADREEGA